MKKRTFKLIISFCAIIFFSISARAEKIFLQDGEMVQGEIAGKSSNVTIVIQSNGMPRKIQTSDIERVEHDAPDVEQSNLTEGPYQGAELQNDEQIIIDPKFAGMTTHDLVLMLLNFNGMKNNTRVNIQGILAQIPEDKRARLESIMNVDEIMEAMVPVYEKHFSPVELQQLIMFYESDLGKKLISLTPQISEEIVKTSAAYLQQHLK